MTIGNKIGHNNGIKGFFITFPKSNIEKSEFYSRFNKKFEVEKAIVAQEPHKDGTPHIHLAATLINKVSRAQMLSYFRVDYPDDYMRIDIRSLKNFNSSIMYLTSPEKDKIIDTNPIMINCSLQQEFSFKHKMVYKEIPTEPEHEKCDTCFCDYCTQRFDQLLKEQRDANRILEPKCWIDDNNKIHFYE